MRYLRAGPERDAAIQRMRNHWAAQEAELRRGSFPVVGLAPPFPGPVALGGTESVNGEVTRVGLLYGGQDPAAGPRVTVSTAPAPGDAESLPVADLLRDALQGVLSDETDDADVLSDRAVAEVTVLLDGVPRVTHTLGNEQVWAAITRVGIDGVLARRSCPGPGGNAARPGGLGSASGPGPAGSPGAGRHADRNGASDRRGRRTAPECIASR